MQGADSSEHIALVDQHDQRTHRRLQKVKPKGHQNRLAQQAVITAPHLHQQHHQQNPQTADHQPVHHIQNL